MFLECDTVREFTNLVCAARFHAVVCSFRDVVCPDNKLCSLRLAVGYTQCTGLQLDGIMS